MVHFDGKDYQTIALHGGGYPMFGHYIGLFKTLKWFEDFKSLNTPFITSSAGSMAILYFVLKMKDESKDVSFLFSRLAQEAENVLSNFDQKSVISYDFIDNLISTEFECIYKMTFRDLNELNPNFKWTICCAKYDNFELSLQTYGTHTPDVIMWKACIASSALPILIAPIEINGCLNCDGDLSNWVEGMDLVNDESILHIGPKSRTSMEIDIKTEIKLIDEIIQFSSNCFLRMMKKKESVYGITEIEFNASLNKDFLSEEYIESGRLMADKFVLK